ncbi:malate:quinone oxidoreductase [Flavobacterium gawalongense]|uniref:Probable malate:quinone oxidoreductase n=1 Tax=Flavobacterium gawalongense TaxID=2594432 RepID=A0A553BV67_9FLAO|nr:malate:quinone oxidoreductase [Flavobacterium gawalongense]TRX02770.1 malate:quinone oxidoreductase [Flavobacterium gawalongense]TRX08078.1 malate:quinone oxidoreductase [Flavobacterium gawalongense]TRX11356.1 malate:quinone oxidoreductase [Flavobacterium gawalongense]TRX12132.1 malate:quinone oxidoreductase [Flavobacterium gawalongense]TRX28991.1 malate:quinone oxidoreductase [Flavobacterium gawalongense]
MPDTTIRSQSEVVLIGAGIMSATLGLILKELQPDIKIEIYERLDIAAAESSDAWNNAGTGHSAFCELNYTPESADGTIDPKKAISIAESFEVSRQFWAYLVQEQKVSSPENFIKSIPHMSFVWGDKNVEYLKKRFEALHANPLFKDMLFSTDFSQLKKWMPLVMEGRNESEKVAATSMAIGTDVNFGELTRSMFNYLTQLDGVTIHFHHEVKKMRQREDKSWRIKITDLASGQKRKAYTKFVFIGAGGGSLPLLEKANVPEGKGYGGFPVSGQWLKCTNPEVIAKHQAKVYGKASVGAPPMSVPHIDSRMINGEKALLFGPFAGFSTRFLKNGSYSDLPLSIKTDNIIPMIAAGIKNIPLTKYLIEQVRQSPKDRINALREYVPGARSKDWKLERAGQRVQVIKKDEKEGGILEFGTEVITTADGSLSVLLGASPGASTAVSIMIDLIGRCFKEEIGTPQWQEKLKMMIPSYGQALNTNPTLLKEIRKDTAEILKLNN